MLHDTPGLAASPVTARILIVARRVWRLAKFFVSCRRVNYAKPRCGDALFAAISLTALLAIASFAHTSSARSTWPSRKRAIFDDVDGSLERYEVRPNFPLRPVMTARFREACSTLHFKLDATTYNFLGVAM
jgi:hypothetical protein